jgi:hypothetical protein
MQRPIAFEDFAHRSIGHGAGGTAAGPMSGALTRIRTGQSARELLEQLRGRVIDSSGDSWRIEVFSIVDDSTHRWVQVCLTGADDRSVLLKLARFADDADAVSAIRYWIEESHWTHGGVLEVSPSN